MTKRSRPGVRIETQGDVHVSMDDVGRDKIVNSTGSEGAKGGIKKGFSLTQWIGTIPALVKLAEFLGISLG